MEYLSPGNGETKTGYFWVIMSPCTREVLVHWSLTRAAATLEQIVPPGWSGMLQCDGYSAYGAFVNRRLCGDNLPGITLPQEAGLIVIAGCMAHVRRGFFEAKDNAPGAAAAFLREFARLYRIEEELRTARAGPDERLRRRQAESRPIMTPASRANDARDWHAEEIVPTGWSGLLKCDGYSAYPAFVTRRLFGDNLPGITATQEAGPIVLAGCMAHVRRGFFDAKDNAPGAAAAFLREFAMLYRIEEEQRTARAGLDERLR